MKTEKHTEHTANLAMATAPIMGNGWRVGSKFFAHSINARKVEKKDFMARLQSVKNRV